MTKHALVEDQRHRLRQRLPEQNAAKRRRRRHRQRHCLPVPWQVTETRVATELYEARVGLSQRKQGARMAKAIKRERSYAR